MGVLTRLAGWLGKPETRDAAGMSFGDGWAALGNMATLGGSFSAAMAEALSSVQGCIELTAGAIASLPATLTQDDPDGQVPAPPTATAWTLLRRPNPRQSWPAFCTSMVGSALLQGNAVAYLQRDGRGAVTALVPVPWRWLSVQVVQGTAGPRLVYDVVQTGPEVALLGLPKRMLDTEVLHLRARSDDGLIGRSVLSRAAGVVREGNALATAAEATWTNGMRPAGVFMSPTYLSSEQRDKAEANAGRFRGAVNAGRTPLLEGGWKFEQIGLTSVDAEFLATRQFSVAEVARLFNVPLGLIQPGQGVQPYEAMLAALAQLALAPLVAIIEAEFDAAVLPEGLHLQLDMSGLLRGNFSAQAGAFATLVQSGILTPNDARRGLGLPAHADGDALRTGAAPNFPADAKGVPSIGPKPGKTGTGSPDPGTHQNEGAE